MGASVSQKKSGKYSEPETSGKNYLNEIPLEILYYILLQLDVRNIMKCRLLCQYLHSVISDEEFWHEVIRSGKITIGDITYKDLFELTKNWGFKEYALLCIKDPLMKNLIKNGCGQMCKPYKTNEFGAGGRKALHTVDNWEILSSAGDGWQVEKPPTGSPPVPQSADIVGNSCFVTSYGGWCSRRQIIDLWSSVPPTLLSSLCPRVVVSVWVCPRFDASGEYKCSFELKDDKNKKLLQEFGSTVYVEAGDPWQKVSHVFPYYPTLRYVHFTDQAQDRPCWAGWYGPKITGAAVKLVL